MEGRVVRTLVPVSVRRQSERGIYNNRVSGLFPGLPVGIEDPVERLNAIREHMEGFKRSGQSVAGDALTRLSLLTSILAATSDASSAVGIYWGNAGATHDPKFFREIAKLRSTRRSRR